MNGNKCFPLVYYIGYGMTELSPASHIDIGENAPSVGPLLRNTLAKVFF